MALTLSDANLVRQRVVAETREPHIQALLKVLFSHIAQHKGNCDLQLVNFAIAAADIVIADVACRLYALYYDRPSTAVASWLKGSDHATTAAQDPDVIIPIVASHDGKGQMLVFPSGLALANGLSIASHTAINGTTDSSAPERGTGFAIVGAA